MYNYKILIIDDEQPVIDAVKKCLKHDEYEIISAHNGKEGLLLLHERQPDVIVLDLRMPVMDGVEFLKQIYLLQTDLYVIVLTGYGSDEEIKECYRMGVSAFLRKPFNHFELLGLVENLISKRKTNLDLKRCYEKIQQENERYRMQDVIKSILKTSLEITSLTNVLDKALELILSVPCLSIQRKGLIHLFDEDSKSLVLKIHRGIDSEILQLCRKVPLNKCLCGIAAYKKEVIFTERVDERHEIRYGGMSSHGHYCVPILSDARLLGVITIYVEEGKKREAEEENFLITAAKTIGGIIEDKRLKERLCHIEASFQTIIDNSADGMLLVNLDGEIEYANVFARQLFGYKTEDVRGRHFGIPAVSDELTDVRILREDGEPGIAEMMVTETKWYGKPCYLAILRDITKRKEWEKAIQHHAELETIIAGISRDFINARPDEEDSKIEKALEIIGMFNKVEHSFFFRYDKSKKIMDMTHEWCAQGIEPQIERFKNLSSDDFTWWIEKLKRFEHIHIPCLRDLPKEIAIEIESLSQLHAMSIIAVPVIYENSLRGFLGLASLRREKKWLDEEIEILKILGDIFIKALKFKDTQLELKESEERFRLLFENAPDSIFLADPERGNILDANKGAEELLQMTKEEIIGLHLSRLNPLNADSEAREKFSLHIKESIANPYTSIVEAYVQNSAGNMIPVEITAEIVNLNNKPRLLCIFRDISTRKAMEEDLKKSNLELKKALEDVKKAQDILIRSEKLVALGELSAGVAHEIKNPINIISTSVQLLMMDNERDKETLESYNTIMEQIHRTTKIIDNLREFARKRAPEIKKTELNSFIEKTISLVEYEMKTENIEIIRSLNPSSLYVNVDQDQLAQVFLNIVNNSRHSMHEKQRKCSYEELSERGWKGELQISTWKDGKFVKIRFKDNGTGIERDKVMYIFDPFFTTKKEGEGTGLGLSIAYGIIQNHSGDIKVEHEKEGVSFIVKLPLPEDTTVL